MTITPINSIKIPDDYLDLCADWHGSIDCLLYAVSSTGGLTTGTHRPTCCDSDEKWYLHLWRGLASDVWYAVCAAKPTCNAEDDEVGCEDYPALVQFEDWVDCIVERLEREYDLTDWDE